MSVNIHICGPDFSPSQPIDAPDSFDIVADNFDFDYQCPTVGMHDTGDNWPIGKDHPMVNENGDDVGNIGWKILPSDYLPQKIIDQIPVGAIGAVYGRIIVSAVSS